MAIESPQTTNKKLYLENGDHLDEAEFLRRWNNDPRLKHAELIEGVVYKNADLRARQHGMPASRLTIWLGYYIAKTPGIEIFLESTLRLAPGTGNTYQPDLCLMFKNEQLGKCIIDDDGYLEGAPALVVEISASSASIDLHEKKRNYEKFGVKEYLVWETNTNHFYWWHLNEGCYQQSVPDEQGILSSHNFPGLRLNTIALLDGDLLTVQQTVDSGLDSESHRRFVQQISIN